MEDNELLQEENDNLYAQNEQLLEKNVVLMRINESIEKEVRTKMTEEWMADLRRKEKAVEARLQIKIDFLKKTHAEQVVMICFPNVTYVYKTIYFFLMQVAELKAKIERRNDEIDQLYEEIEKLKNGDDSGDNSSGNAFLTVIDGGVID